MLRLLARRLSAKAHEPLVLTAAHPNGVYVVTLNNPSKLNMLTGWAAQQSIFE